MKEGLIFRPNPLSSSPPALALSDVEGPNHWLFQDPSLFSRRKEKPAPRRGRPVQKGPRGERACPRGLFQRLNRDYSFSGLLGSGFGSDFGSGLLAEGCFEAPAAPACVCETSSIRVPLSRWTFFPVDVITEPR